MDWYKLLPHDLVQSAYGSDGDEMAWPKVQALKVVSFLEANGYVVTGVDIWIPTNPGPTIPTPFVYDWKLKGIPRADSYPTTAVEFIDSFEWDPKDNSHNNMQPFFNIWARRYSS